METWVLIAVTFCIATAALVCAVIAMQKRETRTYVDHIVYDPAFSADTGPSATSSVHPISILDGQVIAVWHPDLHTRFFQKRGHKYIALDRADFATSVVGLHTPDIRVGKHSPGVFRDRKLVRMPYDGASHIETFEISVESGKIYIFLHVHAREGAIKAAWNGTVGETFVGARPVAFHVHPGAERHHNLDLLYNLPVLGGTCAVQKGHSQAYVEAPVTKSVENEWVAFTFPTVTWENTFYKLHHTYSSFTAVVILAA